MLINITPCAMVARAAMRALRLHILTFFDFSERTELQNAEPGCQITRLLRNQKLEKLDKLDLRLREQQTSHIRWRPRAMKPIIGAIPIPTPTAHSKASTSIF